MLIKPNRNRSRLRRSLPGLGVAGLTLGSLVFLAPSSWGQPTGAGSRPIVKGNLSVEQVEQGLFANPGPMLECYGRLPPPRANLLTRLSFEIDERGRVSAGHVSAPDHPELEPCLDAALLQRTFPAPSSGTVSVQAQTLLTPPYAERRAVSEARESDGQHKSNSPRIPPDVIRAVVRSYYDQFRACYEPRIPSLPAASVTMRFTIGRDGHVSDGEATDETAGAKSEASAALAQCIDGAMRSMQFPAPKDGIVTVDYPLIFKAGDEPSPARP